MPLARWDQLYASPIESLLPETAIGFEGETAEAERPPLLDTAAAVFRQHPNTGLALLNEMTRLWAWADGVKVPESTLYTPKPDREVGYSPFTDPQLEGVPDDRLKLFLDSDSPEETRQKLLRQGREDRDRALIAKAGVPGVAMSIGAILSDPLLLIAAALPVAAPVTAGTRAERIFSALGAVVATDTAYEVIQHQQQELRTLNESFLNVGAGALVTGALGAWVTRIPKKELDEMAARFDKEVIQPGADIRRDEAVPASVGAASAARSLEDNTIAKGGETLAKTVGRISPVSRALTAEANSVRELVQKLVEPSYILNRHKNKDFVESVESKVIQETRRRLTTTLQTFEDEFTKYGLRVRKEGGTPLTRGEFSDKVARAMNEGDISDIPEAATVARKTRPMFEKDREFFTAAGLFPEEMEVVGARSYFPSLFDHEAIRNNLSDVEARLFAHFMANPKKLEKTAEVLSAEKKLAAATEAGRGLDVLEAEEAALKAAGKEQEKASVALRAERKLAEQALRKAEQDVADVERLLESLEDQRASLPELASGTPAAKMQAELAKLDRKIERAKAKAIALAERKQTATSKAIEADESMARLRQEAKASRLATKKATKALQELRQQAKLAAAHKKKAKEQLTAYRDKSDVRQEARDTIDKILGVARGTVELGSVTGAKPTRARTLDVPREVLYDYLSMDFEQVVQSYVRTMVPNIEMRKTFGSIDLAPEIETVQLEYQRLRAAAKTDKEARKISENGEDRINDLRGISARVLNQAGPTGRQELASLVRVGRVFRGYSYWRNLGGQTLSAQPDISRVVARYGLVNTGKALARFVASPSFNRMTRADNKRMAVATDWVLESNSSKMADTSDSWIFGTSKLAKVERASQKASQKFTRITLMATWNATIKSLASILEQDKVLRAALNPGGLTPYRRSLLRLSDDELKIVAEQTRKHADTKATLLRASTDLWDDTPAVRAVAQRLERNIISSGDVLTVTRGAGDLPLIMDSEVAKTLLQFKSFGMAAVNRQMIPFAQGVAHGDPSAIAGVTVSLGLGGMTYAAREYAAGRVPSTDPGVVIGEALQWSGLAGYLPDVWDPFSSVAPEPLRGLRFSRFEAKRPLDNAMGPTFGLLTEQIRAASDVLGPDGTTASGVKAIRRLFPLQNLFYIRRLVNAIEGEIAELLGAPGHTREDFWTRLTESKPAEERGNRHGS